MRSVSNPITYNLTLLRSPVNLHPDNPYLRLMCSFDYPPGDTMISLRYFVVIMNKVQRTNETGRPRQ